ncbi:GtrA family protein [Stutzerimonas kunmingensis]|uniref:GtrA family protein n=1 Tax=Stutzerimonas kunmingensis TaxID=1211807 RepID=UPI00241F2880|nr:GtrA family protein [Stutzerimonas kunmingensis]
MMLLRFGVVGGVNTLIDFAIFFSLVYFMGLGAVAANAISYLVAVVNSYFMNFIWTFRSGRLSDVNLSSFAAFFVCSTLGLLTGSGIIYWLSPTLGVELVKLLSVGVVFFVNFFLSRHVLGGKEVGHA